MEIWDKSKALGKDFMELGGQVADHISGKAILRQTEEFHQDIENVFSALVIRVVAAEQTIDRLERGRTQALAISVVAILVALASLAIVVFR